MDSRTWVMIGKTISAHGTRRTVYGEEKDKVASERMICAARFVPVSGNVLGRHGGLPLHPECLFPADTNTGVLVIRCLGVLLLNRCSVATLKRKQH